MRKALLTLLVMLTLILSGCSGAKPIAVSVVNTNIGSVLTSSGMLNSNNSANHATVFYEIRARPTNKLIHQTLLDSDINRGFKPSVLGNIELQFAVTDNTGQPVKEADLELIADHTNMSDMTIHVKATDQGNGLYAINANFSMPGIWKVTFKVKKGNLEHMQDIVLKII